VAECVVVVLSVAELAAKRVAEMLIVSVVVYDEKLPLLWSSNPRVEVAKDKVRGKHNQAQAWPVLEVRCYVGVGLVL
jgi:hypothetical protein